MKKNILFLFMAFILIIIIIFVNISNNKANANSILKFNNQFEEYKNKELYGADVLSTINKAIDNNNIHNVERNNQGQYIEDDNYSVKLELILLSKDKEGNIKEVIYPMETLEKARIR